jgi:DNA-binding transcriptional LysR family regulator
MDRLTNLEVFNKVVETGSFTAAAEKLGLSRAAVSKHVKDLEGRLGVRLLNRTTRKVSPTEMGRAYYERTTRILADLGEADHAVNVMQTEPKGKLKITAPGSFGAKAIASISADFLVQYPEIQLELGLNDRVVDIVEEGFDLAVRIGELTDSSLIARRLAPFRRILVASPEYVQRHGEPKAVQDLRNHNCIRYQFPGRPPGWRLIGPDGREHSVEVAGNFTVNSGAVVVDAVVKGLGIALVPTFSAVDHLCAKRLVAILPQYRPRDTAIHALYPPNRHLSAKVRAFIDFLIARWSPEPEWDRAIGDCIAA